MQPLLSMAENGDVKLNIAMLPWLAFGHLIPYLELAKLMASKGHMISFISTPRNIDRLPKIPQTLTPFITFIKINLPEVENLPKNAESTRDLPANKVKYLKMACDGLRKPMVDFLNNTSLDWIICDFATYWLGPMVAKHGVRTAYFSVFPALVLGFMGSPEAMSGGDERTSVDDFVKRPNWVSFESEVRPSAFHVTRIMQNLTTDDENVSDTYRLATTIRGCDAVVMRSSFAFEPDWLSLLTELYRKPVITIGLLPTKANDNNDSDDTSWLETKHWLDKREKGSVVYIAFGTETKPSQYELTQLALGLELSGLPFFWVLNDQRGLSDDEVIELPSGFEERTRGQGMVCKSWAPQFKIVSHDSVGVLLIHSGMGSLVDGLQLGKPLVLLPFTFDQGLIASYLVEKKMACMVYREDVDGSFTPESVADSLSLVMVKEDGKMYRERAKEMMSLLGDKNVQDKCLDELMCFLQSSSK
ncbi:putative soyasaponin III rhamnosyltransferase [Helianthus annuus]|nr:putative soyasaponin III rhamnosyltransferase [Helianthus annuus]KAJ0456265.1 putative soyasaponin III rhamnosyltransferase [Helianthus annuus]KAJ0649112.1 putative soyasaponin III rhamnosyltransferase [Helianthus annuus]KAJ0845258.1 putative soyasaponin III rhamnosyltransferase [Helianthus annuus]